ncbi:STAS domain-containing protein [Beggiatoa leptomitoformis]|uniref:STAS domain-containing protein n=1 Tax=Beggiatoa leptomitoformis TaxID=288004 RepID=A0A2N9YGA2_9GAMM|nr:STAS domain-containing protein [Beggiatoa leptomitoformis]ALG68102.1 STAS domain-containing protein [Beggiatoa leptomitoformis]AUI69601.1 STAS domain-containing protein [Beggiatoa leptomitoformis]
MSQLLIENPTLWRFTGELTFNTVPALLTDCIAQAKQSQFPQTIELEKITYADSAGLALLIELRKLTPHQPVEFRHLPTQLLSLAQVSNVQDFLTSVNPI